MERAIGDRNILDIFCTAFCDIVETHATYIIVSGFLAIASGRTRGTEDIDMILERLDKPSFIVFHQDLISHGFVCMQSDDAEDVYDNYLAKNASVRYTQKDRHPPEMEVTFAKDELDYIQLQNKVKIPLTGLDVWFGSIKMNIAFKEEYLKSDKDMEDARHLRIVFSEQIREDEINSCKQLIRRLRL